MVDVIKFDYKDQMDEWLAEHEVTPITVIRGVEKQFKTKITFV